MNYYFNLALFFNHVVHENGSKDALRYLDRTYSYNQLNDLADQWAILMLADGLEIGDVVVIVNTKEVESIALMLACLKTGIIYTNIDVATPEIRMIKIFEQCCPKAVYFDCSNNFIEELSQKRSLKILQSSKLEALNLEQKTVLDDKARKIVGDQTAYIMFTSGSTGVPKGVAISHQNLIHFIQWSVGQLNISYSDSFANVSPFYFDNSVFDFYTALFSGASLVPIKKEILENPIKLINFVGTMKCTIWFSVPSLLIYLMSMKALNKDSFMGVRAILFGGEGYPKIELKKIFDLFSSRIVFINVYGPTECTCICSKYVINTADFDDCKGLPPLGSLNQNFDYLILDEKNEESNEGELILLGPNVGSGYFNDPERSKLVFSIWATGRHQFMKAYKTGDIVKFENKIIKFIGRKDNQIKHMGYRIELEEIENSLNLIPGVDQAAVIYNRTNSEFGKIFAFIAGTGSLNKLQVQQALSQYLPNYMIPNRIIIMETLPKNANGKVDRQNLMDFA